MANLPANREWLKSQEVRRLLRISTCQLAHLRHEGKLKFRKVGNAYLYAAADVDRVCRSDRTCRDS